ncbi:MAG: hypothetical protein GX221_08695 [Candidatus Riflebacteria bacterium]|nr:hypothetical protein [Candidatus Riflebacteria bacterium]
MAEFRKYLTAEEISEGRLTWTKDDDAVISEIFPQALLFSMKIDDEILTGLSVDREKRSLFVGEVIKNFAPGSEILLISPKTENAPVQCHIMVPQEQMIIQKRLSLQEYNGRYLKWFAREDNLYARLFLYKANYNIEIFGKQIKGRAPDFEKRKLFIGNLITVFSPGDDLLIRWATAEDSEIPVLKIEHISKAEQKVDGNAQMRAMVSRILSSAPISGYDKAELHTLILMLDENKKLWEKNTLLQEENQSLKEHLKLLESVCEQFSSNSMFQYRRDFEQFVLNRPGQIEKGLKVVLRDLVIELPTGRQKTLDALCIDRLGVYTACQFIYKSDMQEIDENIALIQYLHDNKQALKKFLPDPELEIADVRGLIIADSENDDLLEKSVQSGIKLAVVKTGSLIETWE